MVRTLQSVGWLASSVSVIRCWFEGIITDLCSLSRPGAQRLLPGSFYAAASQELNALFPISNRYELTDILVADDR
jgi:hypothetical protein